MTTVQLYNKTDLEQNRHDLERTRRDRRTSGTSNLGAYIGPGGETVTNLGDLAPWSRSMPFPQPEGAYGREDQPIGFFAEPTDPGDPASLTGPVLNVEDWRQITFRLLYRAGAANGVLALTPLYGNSKEKSLLPLYVPSTAQTVAGEYVYNTMYKQQFRTPAIASGNIFECQLRFDVSAFLMFALSIREMNTEITCTGDTPVCSHFTLHYSLSM